ncbi:hypothetical protein EB796_024530 [Bugula neritina]|uniref:Uncharacterized protein n=1 Tax=Bugula neritina TaxID=10212 RepID=A0A7J7ITC1_BUGNE|nr:hypothetical protein EB796_024530 [Bugula neritina]
MDTTMKEKLSDFFSGLSTGNVTIVRKVEKMVHKQRSEIELLNARINSLNRQVNRQKEYYTKRESIIKEMYEEELSMIENAHISCNNSEHCEVLHFKKTAHQVVKSSSFVIGIPTHGNSHHSEPALSLASPKRDASTSTEVPGVSSACPMPKLVDASCSMLAINDKEMVSKCIQKDLVTSPQAKSVLDKTLAADYLTCGDDSPLKPIGDKLTKQLNKELNDDKAFHEVEKLHGKTQYLYRKLNVVLKELCENTGKICTTDLEKTEKLDFKKEKKWKKKNSHTAISLHAKSDALKAPPSNRRSVLEKNSKNIKFTNNSKEPLAAVHADLGKNTAGVNTQALQVFKVNKDKGMYYNNSPHDTNSHHNLLEQLACPVPEEVASDAGQTILHKATCSHLDKKSLHDDRTVNSDVSTIATLIFDDKF